MVESNMFRVKLQEDTVINEENGQNQNFTEYSRDFFRNIVENVITPAKKNKEGQEKSQDNKQREMTEKQVEIFLAIIFRRSHENVFYNNTDETDKMTINQHY